MCADVKGGGNASSLQALRLHVHEAGRRARGGSKDNALAVKDLVDLLRFKA